MPRTWMLVAVGSLTSATVGSAQAPDSGLARWTQSRAIALYPDSDLVASTIVADLKTARIVGVGESVHNVEEFLLFRFRLLKALVEGGHVSALALESGMPEGRGLDDFVTGRTETVNFDSALTYGFGAFAQVRETINWLRSWNLGPGRGHPVRVYGIDLPASAGSLMPALEDVLIYLDRVDPTGARGVRTSLIPTASRILGAYWAPAAARYDSLSAQEKSTLRSELDALTERIERNRAAYVARSDPDHFDWALRMAEVARQAERMYRLGALHRDNPRDQAMAANLEWVAARQPHGLLLVWAHNAHVQKVPIAGPSSPAKTPAASLGTMLARTFGQRYLAIGTAYGGPALDTKTDPEPGSVDAALGGSGVPGAFYLGMRGDQPPDVRAWLARERPIRFQVGHLTVPLSRAFDAVVYFASAAPAR